MAVSISLGMSINHWSVVRLDQLGKRAIVRCESCERVMQASVEALLDGTVKRCGCSARLGHYVPRPPDRAAEFAHGVAALEAADGKGRHHSLPGRER